TIWRHIRPSKALRESREAFSTPIPFSAGGVTRLLVAGGDALTSHDLDTGKELWRWGQWNPNRIPHWRLVPSPVTGEGLILVCPPKNTPVYAIRPPTDAGKAATVEWVSTEERDLTSDVPTPAFYDGDFFILSDLRDYLSRAEPATGKVKWSIETPGSAKYEASPLAADGKLYLINHDGEVTVVDAEDGRIISTIAMDKPTNENPVRASISAAYGQLFIRMTSRLYCVGEGEASADAEIDSIRKKAESFFDSQDANNDGMLSRQEFGRSFFDAVDADRNGMVSLQEDIAFRTGRLSRQPRDLRRSSPERRIEVADGAKIERDIVYTTVGEREMLLDLYLPLDAAEPLPVIAWIHGGGWKGGSKGSGGKARAMLERGYAVVDVAYRLSGEAIFPAQVQDCKAAIRWIRANAAKYGLDADRIGVWGGSAGGHLVAFLGTSGDIAEFETKTNAKYSSGVQAVCDWYGPTDLLQMDAHAVEGSRLIHDSPDSPESRLVGGPIQQEPYSSLARKANPIEY
ncbi:MAG: alpha/beta hydrolase fold domain-containing protein, partial [Gammaproteobacteria bacterium]|nr:alpha/beta hydrolase fold domain-containing protein [Gammaproteobacteria bacterium]